MKNKILRLIALMLAIVFCMLSLAACGEDDDGDGDGPQDVTGEGESAFDGVSFEGKTLKICHSIDSAEDNVSSMKYFTAPDAQASTDAIVKAAKERNDYVNGKLKINLVYSELDDEWNTVVELVTNLYTANDDYTPDVVIVGMHGQFQLQLQGIFRNLNTENYTNYFNFRAEDGWYTEAMKAHAFGQDPLNGGKVFIALGDVFIDTVRCAAPLFVNEALLKEKNIYNDVKEFYDLIEDGQWTWDEMIAYCNQVYSNKDSDPGISSGDDLGFIITGLDTNTWHLSAASGMQLAYGSVDMELVYFDNGSGQYKYNETNINGSFATLANKLEEELFGWQGGYMYRGEDTQALRTIFKGGRALFCGNLSLGDLEGSTLAGMEMSPIPFPKLLESDRYVVRSGDGAKVGTILKNSKSFTVASAYLQYMCIKSADVLTTYYDKGLGLKYESGANTKRMLDLIYDNLNITPVQQLDQRVDIVVPNGTSQDLYSIIGGVVAGKQEVSSWWATVRQQKVEGLAALCTKYANLDKS